MRRLKGLAALVVALSATGMCNAQSASGYFSPLSADKYTQKIASIKSRKAVVEYTDKKQQQAYADIIKERNESITDDLEKNRVVVDTLLLQKCNSIVEKIKSSNPAFSFDSICLYINRSPVANASCYGEGTLFVNLGLFLWIENDDELALVIAHELSHQFLAHSESMIRKNIELLSSDDFKNEMKAIKKSSDGRYERYKNLVKDLVTQNGTHSRYKESEADSLGVVLIKNAGYNVRNAAALLLKLDHVDELFSGENLYNLKNTFSPAVSDTFAFRTNKKYNGLSMVNVTMNADREIDSVKTHPDCVARYKKILDNVQAVPEVNCCKVFASGYSTYRNRALVELVRYAYEAKRLTLCSHLCLIAIQNGLPDPFYTEFLSLSFSEMYNADKHLEKFSTTNMSAKTGSTLKELQDFIFKMNSENLAGIAGYFLNSMKNNSDEDYLFAQMMYRKEVKNEDITTSEQAFKKSFPYSKYNYLLNPKKQ